MFFLDLPEKMERQEAICQYAGKCLRRRLTPEEASSLAVETEGYSYADLEYVVKEAAQQALLYGDESVAVETLKDILKATLPFAKTNPGRRPEPPRMGQKPGCPGVGAISSSGRLIQ